MGARAVALTATEYELLRILSVNAGRVVTFESVLGQTWDAHEPTDTERARAFVKQLRANHAGASPMTRWRSRLKRQAASRFVGAA